MHTHKPLDFMSHILSKGTEFTFPLVQGEISNIELSFYSASRFNVYLVSHRHDAEPISIPIAVEVCHFDWKRRVRSPQAVIVRAIGKQGIELYSHVRSDLLDVVPQGGLPAEGFVALPPKPTMDEIVRRQMQKALAERFPNQRAQQKDYVEEILDDEVALQHKDNHYEIDDDEPDNPGDLSAQQHHELAETVRTRRAARKRTPAVPDAGLHSDTAPGNGNGDSAEDRKQTDPGPDGKRQTRLPLKNEAQ